MFVGDEVYAMGYPLFSKKIHDKPTMTKGYVSKVSPFMLKTTSSVLAGSSGGGLFVKNGKLIGIIVANAKLEGNNVIYPRINMAIPVNVIYHVLQDYFTNQGNFF